MNGGIKIVIEGQDNFYVGGGRFRPDWGRTAEGLATWRATPEGLQLEARGGYDDPRQMLAIPAGSVLTVTDWGSPSRYTTIEVKLPWEGDFKIVRA